jgi:hypothetical protein
MRPKNHRSDAQPVPPHPSKSHPPNKPWGDVVGVPPTKVKKRRRSSSGHRQGDRPGDQGPKVYCQNGPVFLWNEDTPPAENYARLGERLAGSDDLFRSPEYGSGLTLLLSNGKPVQIDKGEGLLPVIIDRVPVQIIRDGKPKGGRIAAAHLNAMLKSESFLGNFRSVDRISTHLVFL